MNDPFLAIILVVFALSAMIFVLLRIRDVKHPEQHFGSRYTDKDLRDRNAHIWW